MRHGSLFSGIGGFDLAAEWMGWENVFHCEWNDFGKRVLHYYWPNAISYDDITKSDFTVHRGQIDILTGGFPCQDASIAKQCGDDQQGINGARTGLIREMLRAIDEISPRFIVAENVANLLKIRGGRDFAEILQQLSGMGYNAEWRVCYASEQGAPHHRARMYMVAYPLRNRLEENTSFFANMVEKVQTERRIIAGTATQVGVAWGFEPPFLCMDDGVSSRLVGSKLRAYGNAIVPEIAFKIFKSIEQFNQL